MTLLFRYGLITGCMFLLASPGQAAEPTRIRVLSYNIHHAEGIDGRLDLKRIAGVIRSVHPDLVALQEVEQKTKRTQSVDQPAELARMTDMHHAFGANIPYQGGHYGNAVLSKFPIDKHTNHLLPNDVHGEQRGVMEVVIAPAGGLPSLTFYATHLDHRHPQQRLASANLINAMVEGSSQPALLAGDLNATRDSPPLKRFAAQWQPVNEDPLPTIPVGNPTRQIDFILVRPQGQWKVIDVKVLEEATASDHRPILAVLQWLPRDAR